MEVLVEFIEACCQAAELFEVCEGSFDAVALAIEGAVEAALHFSHRAGRDDGADVVFSKMVQDGIGVVALVCEHGFGPPLAEQREPGCSRASGRL